MLPNTDIRLGAPVVLLPSLAVLSFLFLFPPALHAKEPMQRKLPLRIRTVCEKDNQFHLELAYLEGFKLNDKVPPEKRIRFSEEKGGKTFDSKVFKKSTHSASLSFASPEKPSGSLEIYLCRADRCMRLREKVLWNCVAAP